MFKNVLGRVQPGRQRRFRPTVERLEARDTPTLLAPIRHVNTATALAQRDVVSASAETTRVLVWVHEVNANNTDIRAQRVSSDGVKVGREIIVASSGVKESEPAVCIRRGDRGFYISYTRQTTSGNKDVLAVRYSSEGVRLRTVVVAGTGKNEYDSSIACNSAGAFVVTYTVDTSATNQDIMARRHNVTGDALPAFAVAASPTKDETNSSVARNGGDIFFVGSKFSVAYVVDGRDIHLKRYDSAASLIGTHFIATSAATETNPSVAIDNEGNTLVAFQKLIGADWDIFARKVSSTGVVSVTFGVQTGANRDTDPSVAMTLTSGEFIVGYQSKVGSKYLVYLAEMKSSGAVKGVFLVAGTSTAASKPSVSINSLKRYMIAYTVLNGPGDSGLGVFARLGQTVFIRA
jgi:hypothetical protein